MSKPAFVQSDLFPETVEVRHCTACQRELLPDSSFNGLTSPDNAPVNAHSIKADAVVLVCLSCYVDDSDYVPF